MVCALRVHALHGPRIDGRRWVLTDLLSSNDMIGPHFALYDQPGPSYAESAWKWGTSHPMAEDIPFEEARIPIPIPIPISIVGC